MEIPTLTVREILIRSKFDKLIFKKGKGKGEPNRTDLYTIFGTLIKERILPKFKDQFKNQVKIELNTILMQKIADLKNKITDSNLLKSIIDLEKEYIDSVLESDLESDEIESNVTNRSPKSFLGILYDIYDIEQVKRVTTHNCDYRWFEFKKKIKPCIDQTTSNNILEGLYQIYKTPYNDKSLTTDCTQNAFLLLNYIYTNNIPRPLTQTYVPLPLTPPTYVSRPLNKSSNIPYVGLYDFLLAIETFNSKRRRTTEDLNKLVNKFNILHPKAAFVFVTYDTIYRNKNEECKNLRFHQTVDVGKEKDECRNALETINLIDYRNSIRISSDIKNPGVMRGLQGMDIDSFYEKVRYFNNNFTVSTEKTVTYADDFISKLAGTNQTRRTRRNIRGGNRRTRRNR
jgi:hypothetical protein